MASENLRSIVQKYRERCANNNHLGTRLFRARIEPNVDAVVCHCDICGLVMVVRESDGRQFGLIALSSTLASKVLAELARDESAKKGN